MADAEEVDAEVPSGGVDEHPGTEAVVVECGAVEGVGGSGAGGAEYCWWVEMVSEAALERWRVLQG